ncbi:MAG TPA: hypothetical protein VEH04_02765 [Verrucomicrobiae bacterium]|nr:hypothetical protein [Verrucomicrobiae bacterium]
MSRLFLALSVVLACGPAFAQSAQDYFHRGAQFYVFGDKPKAAIEVQTGLQRFPMDRPLNELAGLLRKEEQEQQQQQQQQKQEQQQEQNEPQEQQQNSQPNQDQQQGNEQQQREPQQAQNEQQKPESKQGERDNDEKQSKEDQQQQSAKANEDPAEGEATGQENAAKDGRMTPEQAMRLLDNHKESEQMLPIRPDQPPEERSKPVRDW